MLHNFLKIAVTGLSLGLSTAGITTIATATDAPAAGPTPAPTAAATSAGDLRVRVDDVHSDKGYVMIALYDSEAAFSKRGDGPGLRLPAHKGAVTGVFADLPAGNYAVAVFHDENGNGKLDANLLGMPTEGYGFSNDAHGNFGPPGFADAKIALDGSNRTITIHLDY